MSATSVTKARAWRVTAYIIQHLLKMAGMLIRSSNQGRLMVLVSPAAATLISGWMGLIQNPSPAQRRTPRSQRGESLM